MEKKLTKLLEKIEKLLEQLPVFLKGYPRLYRLCKYIFSAFVIYFVFKTPVIMLLTEIVGLHYVISGFVAGSILTLMEFIPNEFWVWKRKPTK